MVARHSTRLAVAFLTLLTLFAAVATTPAVAADALREETSLGFVGEDVAFYATMLRNREQVERFTQSNAFAKLKRP